MHHESKKEEKLELFCTGPESSGGFRVFTCPGGNDDQPYKVVSSDGECIAILPYKLTALALASYSVYPEGLLGKDLYVVTAAPCETITHEHLAFYVDESKSG